jgi:hypothetical protein
MATQSPSTRRLIWGVPLVFSVLLLVHGLNLGLTDDEAYYWVLAQTPSLGYAFHPPGVAWLIAGLQKVFVALGLPPNTVAGVRLPAVLLASASLMLALRWLWSEGATRGRSLVSGALAVVSLVGIFGMAWMMVPDLPLILGWSLAFFTSWKLVREDSDGFGMEAVLMAGVAISVASKFSGGLVGGQAFLGALALGASSRARIRIFRAVAVGTILGLLPSLLWNAQNGWGALLYQFRDRHGGGGGFNGSRYLRFWVSQLLLAGPGLVVFSASFFRRAWSGDLEVRRLSRWTLCWALPPGLVFLIQPAFADFKPHWALIVWLPFALEGAWHVAMRSGQRWYRVQLAHAAVLFSVLVLSLHWPAVPWVAEKMGKPLSDPRWDVTNDLQGWENLGAWIASEPERVVVGSRYQTASQAAFALGSVSRATLLPRDRKQWEEWPDLSVSDSPGPEWPKLSRGVWFVADNRYDQPPAFREARCELAASHSVDRQGYPAKRFQLWRCDPVGSSF